MNCCTEYLQHRTCDGVSNASLNIYSTVRLVVYQMSYRIHVSTSQRVWWCIICLTEYMYLRHSAFGGVSYVLQNTCIYVTARLVVHHMSYRIHVSTSRLVWWCIKCLTEYMYLRHSAFGSVSNVLQTTCIYVTARLVVYQMSSRVHVSTSQRVW